MKDYTLTRRRALTLAAGGALLAGWTVRPGLAAQTLIATPAQGEGPFYPIHQQTELDADLTIVEGRTGRAEGQVILVEGQVRNPDGGPIGNALVDVWQANHYGRYAHEMDTNKAPLDANFQGWAKIRTDAEGRYRFKTIKPGSYTVGDRPRPPHIHFKVSGEGHRGLTTQMYFAGEPLNEGDSLFREAPADQRHLLVSTPRLIDLEGGGRVDLCPFDIVLARA